jgi:hypothetical protein
VQKHRNSPVPINPEVVTKPGDASFQIALLVVETDFRGVVVVVVVGLVLRVTVPGEVAGLGMEDIVGFGVHQMVSGSVA